MKSSIIYVMDVAPQSTLRSARLHDTAAMPAHLLPTLHGRRAAASGPALGSFIFLRDAASTEIALGAGHDFVIADLEHAPLDLRDVEAHQRAAEAHGGALLVRLPGFDAALLGRLLNLGVAGAVLPHYGQDLAAARAFGRALRYPPAGTRPACSGVRAAGHGLQPFAQYAVQADARVLGIGLVEDAAVLDRLDALLAEAPVDAVMAGPGDLSTSLGLPGQPDHPQVQAAIGRIAAAATRHALAFGVYLNAPEELQRWPSAAFAVHLIDARLLAQAQRDAVARMRAASAA